MTGGGGPEGGEEGGAPPTGTPHPDPTPNPPAAPPSAPAPAAPAFAPQAIDPVVALTALQTQHAQQQALLAAMANPAAFAPAAMQATMANPAALAALMSNPAMMQAMQAMSAAPALFGGAAPAGFPVPSAPAPAPAPAPAAAPAPVPVAPAAPITSSDPVKVRPGTPGKPETPTSAHPPPDRRSSPASHNSIPRAPVQSPCSSPIFSPCAPTSEEPCVTLARTCLPTPQTETTAKVEPMDATDAPAPPPVDKGKAPEMAAEPLPAPADGEEPVKRKPGRPPGSKTKKKPVMDTDAAAAAGLDADTVAEIPEELLAEALGVTQGRRSGRKTKARVIMIDGEPVLRSNAYTMNDGEPSVFDKELGDGDAADAGRTQYNFEAPKRKYTKSGKPRKPYTKRQKTEEEAACGKHNREVAAAIELANSKRAAYLQRHAKALAPFVDQKVMDKIEAQAEAYVPSEKILAPVDNQPESIKAVLREYQLEGIRWLVRMFDDGCSCILADEMGLGKTLQSISFLACLKELRGVRGPHLVICPLSVLSSWMDELQKWCPDFRVVRLHSTDEAERQRLRKEVVLNVADYDIAVTTYEMACNPTFNLTLSQKVYWRTMILDEGHKVKNEETAAHSVLSRVHRQHTLLLTGTPVQNNLHELYAILAFLHPDVFTNAASFDNAFDLGTKEHKVDSQTLDHAHYLMKPFVLRRVKGEVEVSLPEKTETKIMCPLSPAQTFWYRRLLMRESGAISAAEAAEMRKHSGGGGGEGEEKALNPGDTRKLQSLLMQLRKCCNHPFLFAGSDVPDDGVPLEDLVEASGKLAVLDRILERLKSQGHRVVLFSQFTSMLDILQDFLTLKGYQYARLDGSTNRVQRSIDIAAFNRPNSPMFAFLLSTRAGGLGVNLQTADTCILFDSDWNPQVDTQAMARVHRIGQKKPVHVYRLVTAGTVEERMQQRAEKKLFLEQMVSRGSTKQSEALEGVDKNDIYGMLRFGVDAIFANDEGKPPTDDELEILMDRGPEGNKRRSELAALQSDVQHTVADFTEGKASAAPISTYVMPAQIADEGGGPKKPQSLKDINAEFQAQILTTKRERKKTTVEVDGHTVLKANNYSLEEGEQSVFAREVKQKKTEQKKARAQVAGRDYGHSYTCQVCWDGGDIVCCDLCPVSVHAECIGLTQNEIAKATRWACPHHSCAECGRKAAAVGGMLFRCEACPRAFCEDHLPASAEIIGQCKRFQALGQRHPAQACFIRCDADCIKWAKEKRLEEGGDEAEEAQGWTIGAKVALTDAWIEERDHEIELPIDPAGGRTKPLAHATFTDLVHFLLRMEGPKRKDVRRKKKDAVGPSGGPSGGGGGGGGWEEELENADPQPGDEIEVGGVKAYYTKGWEKLDDVARKYDMDPKDLLAWNKPSLPALTQKAYLIEHTRLWLGPPPESPPETEPEDPEAVRARESEELAAAAAAAQHAGIAAAKNKEEDEYRDEPMVLGRPLKGLRQKDIDPNEREAIMTEMFKRVRPFLERDIEKAKERAAKRRAEENREDEERRKQEAIRAERLMRRTEGIPVHLLSATASDIRSTGAGSSRSAEKAPYGGIADDDKMTKMQDALLRALDFNGAREPDGEWLTAAEVKVRMARMCDADVVADTRKRWDHVDLGEALGFVLAVCAADRAEKIRLKRHEKHPEAVDLASIRLAEGTTAPPPKEGDASASSQDPDPKEVNDPERGVLPPRLARVRCGEMEGELTPGGKRGEESVRYEITPAAEGTPAKTAVVPATEFERLGGRGSTRKWRQSLRYVGEGGDTSLSVGKFLRQTGNEWRDAVVGRSLEILNPEDARYYAAEIINFKPESGEHEVMYADGAREWIYVFLQGTRWPDGIPEALPPPPKPEGGASGDGDGGGSKSKSKSRSGGTKGGRGARFDPSQMSRPEAPEPTVATGPPPGAQVIEGGRPSYYTVEGESVDAAAACLKLDFRDVLAWNRRFIPGLTRRSKLRADTRLWITDPPADPPVPSRGDGGGLLEVPGAKTAAAVAAMASATDATESADAAATTAGAQEGTTGDKREAESAEGVDADAKPPPKKKRKKKPSSGAKPKTGDHEEDVANELDAACVILAASAPVFVGELRGRLAPGCFSGAEEIMIPAPLDDPGPEVDAAKGGIEGAEGAEGADPNAAAAEDAAGADPNAAAAAPPRATEVAISLDAFLTRAGCDAAQKSDWKATLLFGGDEGGGEGQPVGGWMQRRGAAWGRLCVGNQLEILRADAARTSRSSASAVAGTSWRAGEVVSYDKDTGEHEVAFFDGEEVRCHLFLQTMRWLPMRFEPVGGVPEGPGPEGGIAYAMPPIPVACGGMRGCLLPGGKRGEELVRYAAPRSASTPGVMAEYTVPATEFERLGGKGTAKKWRQSLRLVAPGAYRQGETMGKWFRAFGSQTGDGSIGRHLEIFWPGDNAFYGGTISAYKTETGEHEVLYDDGGRETLQLSMQTVRWGPTPAPGARERILKEAAALNAAAAANPKSKKKGGGGGGSSAGGGVTEEWIACDVCGKWRKVPESVVAKLGKEDKWHCEQNPTPGFASCDVPEEKWDDK